ncbi:YveK family protein [Pueribacillus sp. YX66]|uniref:YveK family protein n=1 Tax=Pueribacillus sp. YX66 TaxID=3229242 RepID=UPI00358D7052
MEETISLKEIVDVLKKRMKMILLITVIAAAISGVVSFFVLTPIYQSSTQLLVNQSQSDQQYVDVNQVRTNVELINTYNEIIKSPFILDKVIDELSLEQTHAELNGQVNVTSAQNSQVIEVTVEDPNPSKAAEIANGIASVFQTEIVEIMNVDNVNILSVADVSDDPSPVKPNPTLNIAIAIVIGLMVGVGLAFLLEYMDNTIKTEHDIEKHLGLPVLGTIARMPEEETKATRRRTRQMAMRGETIESK